MYLASVEMPVDLDDDLVVLVRRLLSGHDHLGCRQVLQLVHLHTRSAVSEALRHFNVQNTCSHSKYTVAPAPHRLSSLADDSPCSSSRHLDVSLEFDFFLWPEEVLFLQLSIDSALSLQERVRKV